MSDDLIGSLGLSELLDRYIKLDNRLKVIENHDIFKIWTSVRKGGKTTIEAMLNNNRGFKSLRQQIASLQEQLNELEKKFDTRITTIGKGHEGDIKDIDEQIAELKEWLGQHRKRFEKAFETIEKNSIQSTFIQRKHFNLETVLREFYKHKLAKADYTIECLSSKEHVAEKMVDYVKNDIIFCKKQLEKLDSKVGSASHTVKKEKTDALDSLLHGIDPIFLKTDNVMGHPVFYTNEETKELLNKTEKISIGDDLMKRITSHKSVPMDKTEKNNIMEFRREFKGWLKTEKKEYCKHGTPPDVHCMECLNEDSGGEKMVDKVRVRCPIQGGSNNQIGKPYKNLIRADSKLPEVKKSQFVADVGRFQDSLDARSKLPEPKDFYLGEKGFVVLNEKEAELCSKCGSRLVLDVISLNKPDWYCIDCNSGNKKPKTEPEPLNEKAITEYNRGFENGYSHAEEKLIEEFLGDLLHNPVDDVIKKWLDRR